MRRTLLASIALTLAACAPSLVAPNEALRVSGKVSPAGGDPVRVAVFEICSSRFYFFEDCPGKFLGEARTPKAGGFIVEFDTKSTEVELIAFRGVPGDESECARVQVSSRSEPVTLELSDGDCGAELQLF